MKDGVVCLTYHKSLVISTCFIRFADPLLVAYHFEAASFLLPYTTAFDKESWWYSAVVANALQSLHFRNHIFQFNTVYVHDNQKSIGYSAFRQVSSLPCVMCLCDATLLHAILLHSLLLFLVSTLYSCFLCLGLDCATPLGFVAILLGVLSFRCLVYAVVLCCV